jgi:hypothetical protein
MSKEEESGNSHIPLPPSSIEEAAFTKGVSLRALFYLHDSVAACFTLEKYSAVLGKLKT